MSGNVQSHLFALFAAGLNADLAAAGCKLRVSAIPPSAAPDAMTVLDASGERLGEMPDHTDAAILSAFEVLLRDRTRPSDRQADEKPRA